MRSLSPVRLLTPVLILFAAIIHPPAATQTIHDLHNEQNWSEVEKHLPYVIESLDVQIQLNADDTMQVVETIAVRFNESRRGIIRKIPVRYQTDRGSTRTMAIKVGRVHDGDGNRVTTDVSGFSEKSIRLGDEDIYLSPGTRITYVIPYRVSDMTNWFDSSSGSPEQGAGTGRLAELYWNAIGTEWDTTIAKSSVVVKFPEGATSNELKARAFWGVHGATNVIHQAGTGQETDGRITLELTETELKITNNRGLMPYEGLTFALSMPERLVPQPPLWTRILKTVLTQPGLWIFLLTFGALYPLWHKFGRDPKLPKLEVAFEPPDNLGAGEAGALADENVSSRDIAAVLVSLAVKGYLRFHPKEEGWIIKSTTYDVEVLPPPRLPKPLTETEALMLRNLKRKKNSMITSEKLKETLGKNYFKYQEGLYESLVDHGYYQKCPNTVRSTTIGTGVVALFILSFILGPFAQDGLRIGIFIAGVILSFFTILAFGMIMPARTKNGAKAHAQLVGFENYLSGRGEYLNWVGTTKTAEVEFEEYLPYAFALGHVEEWAKSFEGIIKEPPSWYAGPSTSTFMYASFARDLSSMSTSLQSAASPPRSSGASGGSGFSGGSSGGGGGGGGGSSW